MKFLKFLLSGVFVLIYSTTFSLWSLENITDEYSGKTLVSYIEYIDYSGTFSNNVTSNSNLVAKINIDVRPFSFNGPSSQEKKDTMICYSTDILIFLFENGEGTSVGQEFSQAICKLTIILSNNNTETYKLKAGHGMWLSSPDDNIPFLTHLKKESRPIQCYITINSDNIFQSYNFKINPIGFSNAYAKIIPK